MKDYMKEGMKQCNYISRNEEMKGKGNANINNAVVRSFNHSYIHKYREKKKHNINICTTSDVRIFQ